MIIIVIGTILSWTHANDVICCTHCKFSWNSFKGMPTIGESLEVACGVFNLAECIQQLLQCVWLRGRKIQTGRVRFDMGPGRGEGVIKVEGGGRRGIPSYVPPIGTAMP
jgi:hypothetical protein